MSRLSTVAVSTLVPALKVLSTTLPESTFLSLVRTNAPPFPGLTCWNSTTDQSWPSRLSTRPFFRSLVVATGKGPSGLEDHEVLGCRRQQLGSAIVHHQGVLNAHSPASGEVHTGFDGDGRASIDPTFRGVTEQRSLVDLQSDPVAQTVGELVGVPGLAHDVAGCVVDGLQFRAGRQGMPAGPLSRAHHVEDLALPGLSLATDDEGPRAVGVVPAVQGAKVDLEKVADGDPAIGGSVVRDRAVGTGGHDGLERQPLGA